MCELYDAGNHFLMCTNSFNPEFHRHSAAHIIISLGDDIEIGTENLTIKGKGFLIPSRTLHNAMTNNEVLVFMFDHTHIISRSIQSVELLSDDRINEILKTYDQFVGSDKSNISYKLFLNEVLKCVNIDKTKMMAIDSRINDSIKYIQSNINESLTCIDVARHVCLSEGRFSHLFKEQVGMTFASYVIYQRIIKTYVELMNGKSITEASIEAGFSSSAHFSSVNKRCFGLSASMICKEFLFHKIADI